MKKISSAYWKKFINIDSDGNEKGNGKANGRGCSAVPFAKAC